MTTLGTHYGERYDVNSFKGEDFNKGRNACPRYITVRTGQSGEFLFICKNGKKVTEYLVAGEVYPGDGVINIKTTAGAVVDADTVNITF